MPPSLIFGFVGTLVGLLGFAYGFWKDYQVRSIERRAKGPHFDGGLLLIDVIGISYPQGGPAHYSYRNPPNALGERLSEMRYGEKSLPENYPSGHVAGIQMRNSGEGIRYFEAKCADGMRVFKTEFEPGHFTVQYVYDKARHATELRFALTFETSTGYKGKQVWAIKVGELYIRRISPA